MTRDKDYRDGDRVEWPPEAGDPRKLPLEHEPPTGLEDRVAGVLLERGLITSAGSQTSGRPGWRLVRASLAAAAGIALLALGAWIGRATVDTGPAPVLTGAETDLYALLLYETEGYEAPTGDEAALSRYGEDSQWVAHAVRRGQFVTGEDLQVENGWTLEPDEPAPRPAMPDAMGSVAPLSGIFFIRAGSAEEALSLARDLPHLRHGGSVVVQKTIPTDAPPAPDD